MTWRAVSVVTPPAELPVSVAEAKEHCRVTGSDDDTYIGTLLAAAVATLDGPNGYGMGIVAQTWRQSFDSFPAGVLTLRGGPVASVTSVNYVDGSGADQVLDAGEYRVDVRREPARIEVVNSWPSTQDRIGAVWVDYVVGAANAAAVSATLKAAIKMLVAHWYENRESVVVGVTANSVPLGFEMLAGMHRRGVAA